MAETMTIRAICQRWGTARGHATLMSQMLPERGTVSRTVPAIMIAVGVCLIVAGCSSAPSEQTTLGVQGVASGVGPLRERPASTDPVTALMQAEARARRPKRQRRVKGQGYYKVGRPYQISGRWYYPKEDPTYDRTGMASWYGDKFHGRMTANGEKYDMDALTAAHPTLPMPSFARVTNLANNRTVLVRINDRGPYARNRVIDLSRSVAKLLDFKHLGVTKVRVEYVGRAPLNGDNSRELAFLQQQYWYRQNRAQMPSIVRVRPTGAVALAQ